MESLCRHMERLEHMPSPQGLGVSHMYTVSHSHAVTSTHSHTVTPAESHSHSVTHSVAVAVSEAH